MELVPGETLADQIRRGALPVDEALAIAKQITEGLEAAHGKGVVHRDLKQANIKITPQGQVKVLDFGLAKAFAGEAAEVNLSNSPTVNLGATNAGMILGTAAYMSPEQAKGKETDRSCDIWAFGCVLFEMLTGRRSKARLLARSWEASSSPIRTGLRCRSRRRLQSFSLLKRCLQKDPSRRMRDIADARFQIEEAANEPASRPVVAAPPKNHERFLWIAVVLLLAAGLTWSFQRNRSARTGGGVTPRGQYAAWFCGEWFCHFS